nr:hypothetical protein [uncultured Flavobacterium sp.]
MKKNIVYLVLILNLSFVNSKLSAQEQNITISSKINDDNSIDLNYEKINPGSYTIEIQFSGLSNCDIREFKKVIRDDIGFLVKLKPINKEQGIGYAMNYYTLMGEINPKIDSLFHYALPFKNGSKMKFYEAFNAGEKYLGQQKEISWKSYYTQSEKPDTIYSMRKGIVVALTNEYNGDSSIDKQYTTKRNSIVIEHADGTHASYKGFKRNSIAVKLGQTVYPQTKLGVTEIFDNEKYKIDVSIYYFSDPDFKQKNKSLENYITKHKFITPIFVTSEGENKIKNGKEYCVLADEAVITQEFSKSERKKYAKDHSVSK